MNSRRVLVAGHQGLVGSALVRALEKEGGQELLTRTRAELDLTNQAAVGDFFRRERPSLVFLAAGKVGGIQANNTARWAFIYENLLIAANVIGAALQHDIEKLVFFGSSCVYPRLADQPIAESALLSGPLEPTNEPYAIAKIAGIKLVEAANHQSGRQWISIMPTNLYGPGDNFDLQSSHVLPALLRKFHDAKVSRADGQPTEVTLWGSGSPLREFLHVDDLASAAIHLARLDTVGLINAGSGEELSIKQLAALCAETVGYDGPIRWDRSKPDGTPRKLIDSSYLRSTGWKPTITLREGLRSTYEWFEGAERTGARL